MEIVHETTGGAALDHIKEGNVTLTLTVPAEILALLRKQASASLATNEHRTQATGDLMNILTGDSG